MYPERIKQIRKNLGLSIAKMASQLGMSASTLTSYERNDRTPSLDLLSRLYKTFSVNANWFISGKGDMFKKDVPQFEQVKDELAHEVRKILREEGLIK